MSLLPSSSIKLSCLRLTRGLTKQLEARTECDCRQQTLVVHLRECFEVRIFVDHR